MRWTVTSLIPLIATVIYGGIFAVVLFSAPKSRVRQYFIVYLLSMVVWSVSAFITVSDLVEDILPWFKVMVVAPLVMMVSTFYFVQALFSKRNRWALVVFLYTLLSITLAIFTDTIIHSASLRPDTTLEYSFSPWVIMIAGPGYGLMFFNLYEIVKGARQTDSATQRNRLRYLIIGLSITIAASFVNFTELGKYPIDIAANGITAILLAYAILRHQLLEIRVVLRLGLLYSIITSFFGALYYLVIYLSSSLLNREAGEDYVWVSLLTALITAILLTPLRNLVQNWIDRIFYRESYNAGLMLQRLSQTTASLLDLEEITNMILQEVTSTLYIRHAALYVKENQQETYHLISSINIETPPATLRADHPIAYWFTTEDKALTRHEINNAPIFRSLWHSERKDLTNLQIEVFIPLKAKGHLVGILGLGPKMSTQPYSMEDQLTLTTLGNQMAIAVENARLYEDLEKTFVETVVALANAIDLRDTYTSDHSQVIATLAAETARHMGLSDHDIDAVYWGGLLHDIGKIGIPDSILNKPSSLNEEEWDIIRRHPQIGADLVSQIKKLTHIAPLIEYSHERYNGSGYPYGVINQKIPVGARIIGVVDSYSAMVDERAYKQPMPHEEAVEELVRNSGILYDPKVIDAFVHVSKQIEQLS